MNWKDEIRFWDDQLRKQRERERLRGLPSDRRLVWRLHLGSKTLRFWRGNYSSRRIIPYIEHYPFRSYLLCWRWGRLGWTLSRWD